MLKSDFNLAPAAGLHHHPSAASPFLGEQKPSTAAVTSKKTFRTWDRRKSCALTRYPAGNI